MMLAFLNLGVTEMVVILVVAVVVFGRNLPQVAVQAAAQVAKLRRSLTDLRRETGIDDELRRAKREFEQAVPRNLPRIIEQKLVETIEADEPQAPASEAAEKPVDGEREG